MGSKSKMIKKLTAGNLELKKALASTRSEVTRTRSEAHQGERNGRSLEEGSGRASYGSGEIRRSGLRGSRRSSTARRLHCDPGKVAREELVLRA